MTTKNLTAYNECNEREISSMVGKAMCALANWKNLDKANEAFRKENGVEFDKALAAHWSEYEATVRCIDMFVRESIYEIQHYIIERVEAELVF